MTSQARPRRARQSRTRQSRRWLAAAAAGLAPLLASCAATAPPVHLPAKTTLPSVRAAAAVQQPSSPRQQVIDAYLGYAQAMTTAFDSRSATQVRQLLGTYLAAATVRNAIRTFSQAWAKNEISYGQVQRHIIGVRIEGAAAWVHDCDDTSNAGLVYAGTGQVVPGSLGLPDQNLVTRLNLVRGRWVVYVQTVEDISCTP
jgi:hypothetical protein